jgi:hypothetical protein
LDVEGVSSAPAVGAVAPGSRTPTLDNRDGLEQLTTDPTPDEDLYRISIRDALAMDMPLVVTFSTPAYCQSAMCGPQVDVVGEVKDAFKDQVNFIHVEIYSNPHEIEGDLSRAVVSPSVGEWKLPSEPFTFVVDAGEIITAKYEGFVSADELTEAVQATLQ